MSGFEVAGVRVAVGEATLLDGVECRCPEGRWTAVLGPSGSGKSTFLRLLNRLIEPTAGTVRWRDRGLVEYDVQALRREVGLVVQQPRLSPGTVDDNLALPVLLGSVSRAEAATRMPDALARAGLDERLRTRDVADLSGGERQRVAIARALLLGPRALLLDEPTAALDPRSARALMQALRALRDDTGMTLVMVTHRVAEAREHADHAVVLDAGRVVESGAAASLLDAPTSEVTKMLLEEGGVRAAAD